MHPASHFFSRSPHFIDLRSIDQNLWNFILAKSAILLLHVFIMIVNGNVIGVGYDIERYL